MVGIEKYKTLNRIAQELGINRQSIDHQCRRGMFTLPEPNYVRGRRKYYDVHAYKLIKEYFAYLSKEEV